MAPSTSRPRHGSSVLTAAFGAAFAVLAFHVQTGNAWLVPGDCDGTTTPVPDADCRLEDELCKSGCWQEAWTCPDGSQWEWHYYGAATVVGFCTDDSETPPNSDCETCSELVCATGRTAHGDLILDCVWDPNLGCPLYRVKFNACMP